MCTICAGSGSLLTLRRYPSNLLKAQSFKLHYSIIFMLLVPTINIFSQYTLLNKMGTEAIPSIFYTNPELSIWAVVTTLLGSIGEELGWRGYVYRRLRQEMKPLHSAALCALMWGVWHFPKIFNGGLLTYLTFTLSVIPLGTLMCYVTERANLSLLPAIIMHTIANLAFMYFLFKRESSYGHLISFAVLYLLIVLIRFLDPDYFSMEPQAELKEA